MASGRSCSREGKTTAFWDAASRVMVKKVPKLPTGIQRVSSLTMLTAYLELCKLRTQATRRNH